MEPMGAGQVQNRRRVVLESKWDPVCSHYFLWYDVLFEENTPRFLSSYFLYNAEFIVTNYHLFNSRKTLNNENSSSSFIKDGLKIRLASHSSFQLSVFFECIPKIFQGFQVELVHKFSNLLRNTILQKNHQFSLRFDISWH